MSAVEPLRHVAVRPERVPAGRRARRIADGGLHEQDVRLVVHAAFPRGALAVGDLGERAAQVNRRRRGGSPRARHGTGAFSAQSILKTPGP